MNEDIISQLQDMRYLQWSRIRHSSGTAGSFLKSYAVNNGVKTYYKLSCYDSVRGITGHECINELIVDRLLQILGIDHLHYQLIHGLVTVEGKDYETWLCASEDFKKPGESKLALDDYYDLEKNPGESVMDFCQRQGWMAYLYEMLVVDYLILNRDRHGANIEVLQSMGHGAIRTIHLAPLFDHGLSLLYSCHSQKEVRTFDVLADRPVQSFVGSHSAAENLRRIPSEALPRLRPLEERDQLLLMRGLEDALPQEYLDRIWKMLWERWKVYESLQHH